MSFKKNLTVMSLKASIVAALITSLGLGCSHSVTFDEDHSPLVEVRDEQLGATDYEISRYGFNDAVKTARLATIDVETMRSQLMPGGQIEFALPEGGHLVLVINTVQEPLPGVTTFSGHVADDEFSDFTFSIEDGKLVGSIRQGTQAWLVHPHGGSMLHMIRSVDRTMVPKDEPSIEHREASSEAPKLPPSTSLVAGGNVRVLFLYANNVPNANSLVSNIVSAFNGSLSLSAVSSNNKITSAGVQQVASSFNGMSRSSIIYAMRDRTAPFTNIDTMMASVYADIAFLLVQEDQSAADIPGYGRVGGAAMPWPNNQPSPFALSTDDYALGDLTALHEIGHIFGGKHENDANAGIARPVVAANDTWMTMMGGYIECPFNGLPASCVRLNRWSNPDQTYMGFPLGVAGQRDMESWLESSMPTVSGWRAEPPPPVVTVYSNSFESTANLSGWLIWHNCAASSWVPANNVFRYYTASDNPAPGGGAYALRMQTTGFTSGCQYPGAYALSPSSPATAGTTYRLDNMSRNHTQSGSVGLIFYNSAGSEIGFADRTWASDAWAYNADAQLVATAPSGTTSLRVRYGLNTPNGVADLDLLKVTR